VLNSFANIDQKRGVRNPKFLGNLESSKKFKVFCISFIADQILQSCSWLPKKTKKFHTQLIPYQNLLFQNLILKMDVQTTIIKELTILSNKEKKNKIQMRKIGLERVIGKEKRL
jgi:hypothetical protein